jgi:hypothetical protein
MDFDFTVLRTAWEQARQIVLELAPRGWSEIKSALELLAYFLAAIAAIGMVVRVKRLIELVREIKDARSPIWDLRSLSSDVRQNLEDLRNAKQEMNSVLDQIRDYNLKDSIDALQKQFIELQRDVADDSLLASQSAEAAEPASTASWEYIKNIWSDARDKLESVIGQADGRRTRKYGQISRRDYTKVIAMLQSDGLIDKVAADDARYMNDTYLSFRNRRNPVTDELKQEFDERKRSFDKHIKNFKPAILLPHSPPAPSVEPPPPLPPSNSGPRTNGHDQQDNPS